MAVIRIEKTQDYTVMANYHFKERNMSLKAKGLLSLMLSLPEGWDYSVSGLTALSKDGKEGVSSALKELENLGYMKRVQLTDERGRFTGFDYIVSEKPFTENPLTGNPLTGNASQLNTKESNTKESNTRFMRPSLEEVREYCVSRGNDVSPERFIDYYTSNGWKVGKNPMKDWRACVRTWERNTKSEVQSSKEDYDEEMERWDEERGTWIKGGK